MQSDLVQANRDQAIIARTQHWLLRIVIGLNLCPFAKSVHSKQQIDYAVSHAVDADTLYADLLGALTRMHSTPAAQIDTCLLIHPDVLTVFADYNAFLDRADAALDELDIVGEIQIASFHPDYRFAGSFSDDVENLTNRSPYPMLHLLREASVTRAVDAFPDPDAIIERNFATLRMLGLAGWQELMGTNGNPEASAN